MENYHVLELIGEGSFGRVYKGRKKFSGQVVALKFIPKVGRSEKELKSLRREIEIMRNMHHTNIIEMIDSFETEKEVVAVTDYAEGELFQILEDDGSLPEIQVQAIACQLVSALYYLHAHRILHRDMKPQNILLGKGAVVKLCDFGFARAMSINTLVLTSIKGTPLYMSPELVEEKPYDHTADLWALGCILYELFTGQPPFYTNSIFQLVSLIIKDPVRWPKTMSPMFKDFLQGLLTKNPRHRLAWPHLLEHPFVASGVTVSEEDKQLMSPFTCAPTASLIIEKEKQVKAKAHPPGASKILSKAREKVDQDQKKKKARTEAWSKDHQHTLHPAPQPPVAQEAAEHSGGTEKSTEPLSEAQHSHTDQDWQKTGISQMVEPTPRPDRINKDYSREYPSIEVGSCKVLNRQPEKTKKNFENVKLNEEDADSDDEWQELVESTDPDSNEHDIIVARMTDSAFTSKLRDRLHSASTQVLDAILEGASQLRPVLRIIINLVTVKCDLKCLQSFLKSIDCPGHILSLLAKVLESSSVKEQTWCQQIMIDLIATIHAYLSGGFLAANEELDTESLQVYRQTCETFITLLPQLLSQKLDRDLRLREQSVLVVKAVGPFYLVSMLEEIKECIIYVCEILEKMRGPLSSQLFEFISVRQPLLEAILLGAMLDETLLKRLEDLAEGQNDLAQQRMEDLICLNAAAVAALTHLPVTCISCGVGKRKVANAVANLLCDKHMAGFTQDYLLLLNHPSTCSNALKVLYSSCQVNKGMCVYLANHPRDLLTLIAILQGKVELEDMECNAVFEMVLYLLSVIIIQLEEIPPEIVDAAPFLINIFLESQLASHTAAAALLFGQMVRCGTPVKVVPEDILTATLSEFTDLAQICVRCPFDYGVLDGIVLLLSQLLAKPELPMASLYLEHGIWSILWHRVAQMLQVPNPDTDMPLHDIEGEGFVEVAVTSARCVMPDWTLLSFSGLVAMLQMAIVIFTKEMFQVVTCLADNDNIISLTLMHLLSPEFLRTLSGSQMEGGGGSPVDIVHPVVQICCFPFAIDMNNELLASIQTCFARSQLLPRLLHASVTYLKPHDLDLPIGLISRLVLADDIFVEQFAHCVDNLKAVPFFTACLKQEPNGSTSLICDSLSICSHLVRTSPAHLDMITHMFRGSKRDYELLVHLLSHSAAVVRSRTCSMLGNVLKHTGAFYTVLSKCDMLLSGLVTCLSDEDPDVRKGASYAVGNAAYHNGSLYEKLHGAISPLISLLDDPVAKTRANAVGALGNLAIHCNQLSGSLQSAKVIHSVLEMACHDTQYGVQECALMALRSMCSQPDLKKELLKLKAVDKLSRVSEGRVHGSRPASPASSSMMTRQGRSSMSLSKSVGRHSITNVMQHCNRLIKILNQ